EREHLPTWFFDPAAASCAGLIARVLDDGWGWQPPPHLREVVQWADKIDAAQFASAADAVALTAPAQRLAAWLAHGRSPGETARYTGWLTEQSLADIAARPEIAPGLAAIEAERARELDAIARVGAWQRDVVVIDRFDHPGARSPGFLAYLL